MGSSTVIRHMYSKLVGVTAQGEITGDPAESWIVADDSLSITFNLRKGVKFHDGATTPSPNVPGRIPS